jgi:hypothetical protein
MYLNTAVKKLRYTSCPRKYQQIKIEVIVDIISFQFLQNWKRGAM